MKRKSGGHEKILNDYDWLKLHSCRKKKSRDKSFKSAYCVVITGCQPLLLLWVFVSPALFSRVTPVWLSLLTVNFGNYGVEFLFCA